MSQVDKRIGLVLLIFELTMIACFAFTANYKLRDYNAAKQEELREEIVRLYPMFQDIHVMIIIGFGMLMTFLKKYGYSGVSLNLLISAVTFQYAILCSRIQNEVFIDMESLINADVLTATILISFGAVLGKVTPLQILIMVIIEAPLSLGNKYLADRLQVADIGGSISVHTFGTYFGLATSKVIGKPKHFEKETTSYNSNIFSMIGTLFLWAFWPSFNGVLCSSPLSQERAIINTYLALLSSCVVTFAISTLTHKNYKFTMGHIQNATLAGGVAIGSVADLKVFPWAALSIGAIAGGLSVYGYVIVQPWLLKRFGLHDTCGVNNLHGMTSILAGIFSSIAALGASFELYGNEFKELFPAMTKNGTNGIFIAEERTPGIQASFQLLVLALTFVISIAGGTITGLVLKLGEPILGSVPEEDAFNDNLFFDDAEDEDTKESPLERTFTVETVVES